MNRMELIAYAQSFASFFLRASAPKDTDIKEIILFGSVSRGEAAPESDVDIFIDIFDSARVRDIEKLARQGLKEFYQSIQFEQWKLRGISNEIKIKVGVLERWPLRRSIISDGLTLYGKYKEAPKNLRGFALFVFEPIPSLKKRNRLIRILFGRPEYRAPGRVQSIGGKRLSPTVFYIPLAAAPEVLKLFGQLRVKHKIFELWSDVL